MVCKIGIVVIHSSSFHGLERELKEAIRAIYGVGNRLKWKPEKIELNHEVGFVLYVEHDC